jgi:hypothetical protein
MTTRKFLESLVISINAPLRSVVKDMDLIILLRNMHPIERGYCAHELYRNGELTKEQAREFTKIL